jgi:acyl dehydratase
MQVGDTARRSRTITDRDIELFTELTGDRNPLHYDADAAARSRFGGIIVQGGVTSGLLNAVVAEDLPGPGSVFLHRRLELSRAGAAGGRHHRRGRGARSPG